MLTIVFLLACSAAFLEIPIPPRGIDSVHQEDLKRDIWAIEQGTAAEVWWEKRILQLDGAIISEENASCILHQGQRENGLRYWIPPQSDGLGIRLAALLSLAKSSDRLDRAKNYQYCLGKPNPLEGWMVQEIGNISGDNLVLKDNIWQSSSEGGQNFTQLNFELLEKNIRQIIASNSPELAEASRP